MSPRHARRPAHREDRFGPVTLVRVLLGSAMASARTETTPTTRSAR